MTGSNKTQLIRALTKSLERATEPALRERLAAAIERLQQTVRVEPPPLPTNFFCGQSSAGKTFIAVDFAAAAIRNGGGQWPK